MSRLTSDYLQTRHRLIPGRIEITLTLKRRGVADSDITVSNCEKRPVSERMRRFSDVAINHGQFEVMMSKDDLASNVPEIGDVVTLPDTSKARIADIKRELLETRHRCLCEPHLGS